jgi:hypothetical protein
MKNFLLTSLLVFSFIGIITAQEAKDNIKLSGLMFGDYYYNASAFDSSKKDLNGFQFRRIYITTDYTISDNFTSRFRLEADQSSGSLTSGGKVGVMVKDAWLQWKNIFAGSNLLFGISPTPAYDVSEGAWGHRYLEKTIMDLFGIVPSRDFGVDLKGKFSESGNIKYWLKVANNSGNAPELDKYKRIYGLIEFDPSPELLITIYGDYASAAQKLDSFDKTEKSNNSFVGAGFINFKQKGIFSVGLEGFYKTQQNNYVVSKREALKAQNGFGLSVWAFANINENLQIVGRFDTFDPNMDANNKKDGKSLILAGIQYNLMNHVSITPNVEVITYQADSNNHGDKSDITPRLTMFWEF